MDCSTLIDAFYQIRGLPFKRSDTYAEHGLPIPLHMINSSRTLVDSRTKLVFGVVDRIGEEILTKLERELTVQLFADSVASQSGEALRISRSHHVKAKKTKFGPSTGICAVLYGPPKLSEMVGNFLARCRLYLQHPRHCEFNLPYQNPHCLSIEGCRTIYTFELHDIVDDNTSNVEMFANPIDLFTDATAQDALADAATPTALSTELYKHQKQALTFMMQRERGWAMDGHHRDIWREERDSQGRVLYQNIISGLIQTRPPRPFRGGLLIDAPGLGKSLSILALIASGIENQVQSTVAKPSASATLVIVPKTCKLRHFAHDGTS